MVPRGGDGWMTFMWHWAGSPHWVTDDCVGAGVSLSSTWLDRTPTVSRAAVAVGVDVEVTGVGLSHRQRGFNPNLTAGGIPPLVARSTWVQRWEHTPLCFSNRREARSQTKSNKGIFYFLSFLFIGSSKVTPTGNTTTGAGIFKSEWKSMPGRGSYMRCRWTCWLCKVLTLVTSSSRWISLLKPLETLVLELREESVLLDVLLPLSLQQRSWQQSVKYNQIAKLRSAGIFHQGSCVRFGLCITCLSACQSCKSFSKMKERAKARGDHHHHHHHIHTVTQWHVIYPLQLERSSVSPGNQKQGAADLNVPLSFHSSTSLHFNAAYYDQSSSAVISPTVFNKDQKGT